MRKPLLLLLVALAGCGEGPKTAQPSERTAEAQGSSATPALGELPGLYEGGGHPPDQLCIHKAQSKLQFGIVTRDAGLQSCSGTGTVHRQGAGLRLEMGGSASCVFAATVEGGTIILSDTVPAGCAYYCSDATKLASRRLQLREAGEGGAAKAKDLVGDPLCDVEQS